MHPNPIFRREAHERHLSFARARGFGILTLSGDDDVPLISHVPFLLSETGESAELHLVRSNPIARSLRTARPALIAGSGPDAYISPDWYGMDDQVPTWNYVAVHLSGWIERLPQETLLPLLDRQSAAYEARLAPKRPWTTAKMSEEGLARLMRSIVPCRFVVDDVDGTWKLGQNKSNAARRGAAQGVARGTPGMETEALADLMRMPTEEG